MSRDIVAGAAAAFRGGRSRTLSLVVTAVDFPGAGRYGSDATACEPSTAARTAASEGCSKIQFKIQNELQHSLLATAVALFARLLAVRGWTS